MIQTLVFAARLPVLLGASPFYLTPNSPIARRLGRLPNAQDTFLSRLTAMAIETEGFSREDLYTLFLTTRVINFLKSLGSKVSGNLFLQEWLSEGESRYSMNERELLGWRILRELLTTGVLHAATPQGLRPLRRFRGELFGKVWKSLGWVTAPGGAKVFLSGRRYRGYNTTATSGCPLSAV
jgi:hypothetical protein